MECVCVCALGVRKAGEVKYMRTGKTEWARGPKGKRRRNELSREFPRDLVEFVV